MLGHCSSPLLTHTGRVQEDSWLQLPSTSKQAQELPTQNLWSRHLTQLKRKSNLACKSSGLSRLAQKVSQPSSALGFVWPSMLLGYRFAAHLRRCTFDCSAGWCGPFGLNLFIQGLLERMFLTCTSSQALHTSNILLPRIASA